MTTLATPLDEIKKRLAEAGEALSSELTVIQRRCPHLKVAHWDGAGGSLAYPLRICTDCGLEEQGGWWCYNIDCSFWHAREGNGHILGPKAGRTFVPYSFDKIMDLRIIF